MAYNEYDDPHFFEEYAKMGRSQGGLPAAGECWTWGVGMGGTVSMRRNRAQRRCWGSTSVTG